MERAVVRHSASALFGGSRERTLALLRAAWPRAVGPELARRTEVLALEGEALRLRVPDASWRRHLLQMRRPILDRLREVAGPLTPYRLSFTEGGLTAAAEVAARPPAAAVLEAPPSLVADAQVIADPELRARFLEAAARYLGHRKESNNA
jgi:Dna[CI] antecedent, DciA